MAIDRMYAQIDGKLIARERVNGNTESDRDVNLCGINIDNLIHHLLNITAQGWELQWIVFDGSQGCNVALMYHDTLEDDTPRGYSVLDCPPLIRDPNALDLSDCTFVVNEKLN